jgi:hypothetical protein
MEQACVFRFLFVGGGFQKNVVKNILTLRQVLEQQAQPAGGKS